MELQCCQWEQCLSLVTYLRNLCQLGKILCAAVHTHVVGPSPRSCLRYHIVKLFSDFVRVHIFQCVA